LRLADGSASRVNSYPVELRGGEVYVKLEPKLTFKFEEQRAAKPLGGPPSL
jgi:hypothetical protein